MQKLTPLTESAILSALMVLMALAAVYMPLLGIAAALLWACPLVVVIARHGFKYGLMAMFAATALTALLITPMLSVRLAIAFAPGGLMMGYAISKGWSAIKIFLPSVAFSVLAKIIGLAIVFWLTAINPLDAEIDSLREMFDDTFKMYRDMGMDEAIIDEYKERMNESIDLMTLVMPLVVVLMGLTDTFLTYYVMGRVLPRLGQKMPEFPTFSRWRFSSAFLYFFGFALVGMYWGESRNIDWLYRLSVNVEAAVIFLGFTEGISLIRFFMLRYDVSRWIFYVVFFLIITNGILAQIAAFAGLADMLFDYRRHFDGER